MTASSAPAQRRTARAFVLLSLTGIVFAAALTPPVASRLFALGPLLAAETTALWYTSASLFGLSCVLLAAGPGAGRLTAGILTAVLMLIGLELATRVAVGVLASQETKRHLARLSERTYPDFLKFRAHPFLQYTGNRNANNLGFVLENDFEREKPRDTIRIACLGGSTTAEGNWPLKMEGWLDQHSGPGQRFEVLNFGFVGYSSVHVLVNFILNVVDHDPDYVVLHTGWNDTALRGLAEVKTDFSNVFRPFEPPVVSDRWAIRASVIYRWLQYQLYPTPQWADLQAAMYVGGISSRGSFDNLADLSIFRRNVEKIIRLSKVRKITVVLTTMPHSTDPTAPNFVEAEHLDQCNDVMRELHEAYPDVTLLVDLDREMTGRFNSLFEDLAHMSAEGHQIKGELVGETILRDIERRSAKENF